MSINEAIEQHAYETAKAMLADSQKNLWNTVIYSTIKGMTRAGLEVLGTQKDAALGLGKSRNTVIHYIRLFGL